MADNVFLLSEKLLHWLAFALIASAAVLMGSGCTGLEAENGDRIPVFATDRTLRLKLVQPQQGLAGASSLAAGTSEQFVATAANAADITRLVVKVYKGETVATGVLRESTTKLPPFSGTLFLRAISPGRKLVTVDAFSATGFVLFSGEQLVNFAPGASKFVEFLLISAPPASPTEFVGGTVDRDVRLAATASPYRISTPIVITTAGSLVIEGGTDVQFLTPVSTTPDILVHGRLLVGSGNRAAILRRGSGRTLGTRIRFESCSGSAVVSAIISGTDGPAIEVSAAAVSIATCAFVDVGMGVVASNATPTIRGCNFTGGPVGPGGIRLSRSTARVESNHFTDTSTAIASTDSAVMVLSNVVTARTRAVLEGIRVERSAATVAQNRLTGTTATYDAGTTRLLAGLDQGIAVVDSVSGSAATTGRVLIERNTIENAATAAVTVLASDPVIQLNRLLNGKGSTQGGSMGIAVNRVLSLFPKQPLILSNDIMGNSGPAVAYLTDPRLEPAGGGVMGNPGRDGNFVQGNNVLNLGLVPGIDTTVSGVVDGVFGTRTLQVFSVDAVVSATSTIITAAGAPATVR
ncbi:MAG: hypothetical protein HY814_07920 [Candidatus Riflebacteria bacterium]|nr:hypothetical protein [Candidatus Riflebacteria bacterium]